MYTALINLSYLIASVLFIFGLRGLTHPRTAVRGNILGALGMLLAVVVTLLDRQIVSFEVIFAGMVIGSAAGVGKQVRMGLSQADMIKRNVLPIIMLIGVLVMNTGILCESLCLAGSHMSRHKMSHAKNESSETQACPKSAAHNTHDKAESDASIKCDCSLDNEASLSDLHLLSEAALDLTPQLYLTSSLVLYKSSFMSVEPIPLESPPEILT